MQTVHEYPESARQSEEATVGTVWTETLAQKTAPPMLVNRAHFSPGAHLLARARPRTDPHMENGVALVQAQGEPIEIVRAGQTLFASQVSGTGTVQRPPTP